MSVGKRSCPDLICYVLSVYLDVPFFRVASGLLTLTRWSAFAHSRRALLARSPSFLHPLHRRFDSMLFEFAKPGSRPRESGPTRSGSLPSYYPLSSPFGTMRCSRRSLMMARSSGSSLMARGMVRAVTRTRPIPTILVQQQRALSSGGGGSSSSSSSSSDRHKNTTIIDVLRATWIGHVKHVIDTQVRTHDKRATPAAPPPILTHLARCVAARDGCHVHHDQ